MNRRAPWSIRSARPEPLRKSASQQAYGRRGRALLTHPAHRPSAPERTFDVLRRPDIFTCSRQRVGEMAAVLIMGCGMAVARFGLDGEESGGLAQPGGRGGGLAKARVPRSSVQEGNTR